MKSDVDVTEVYDVLELDADFYTLTARMPTSSKTGPLYRLFSWPQQIGVVETLKRMVREIKREIDQGKRQGPEGMCECVLKQ